MKFSPICEFFNSLAPVPKCESATDFIYLSPRGNLTAVCKMHSKYLMTHPTIGRIDPVENFAGQMWQGLEDLNELVKELDTL